MTCKNMISNVCKLLVLVVCYPLAINAACTSPWDSFEVGSNCAVEFEFTNVKCNSPVQLWSITTGVGNVESLASRCAVALKAASAPYGYMRSYSSSDSQFISHNHSINTWTDWRNVTNHNHQITDVTGYASPSHAHNNNEVTQCYSCTNANMTIVPTSDQNYDIGIKPKGYKYQGGQWIASAPSCSTGQIIYPGTSTCVDASLASGATGCTPWEVTPATGNKYCTPGLKCQPNASVNTCMNVVTTLNGTCGASDMCGDSLICKNNKCTDIAKNATCIANTDCTTGGVCVGGTCVAANCHNL